MSLVNTPELRALYSEAKVKPEHATKKFWAYFLKEKFSGPEWNLSSEQPPTQESGDLRRVDHFLERFNKTKWTGVMLAEEKRENVAVGSVQEVESQAFTACCAYLHWYGLDEVFVMTAFGTHARIWFYIKGETYLRPYVPNTDGLSAKNEYIDANTENAAALMRGFEFIHKHRTPRKIRNSPPPSPRPATLMLPSNWHSNEVEWIAGNPGLPSKSRVQDIDSPFDDEDIYDDDPPIAQNKIAPSGYALDNERTVAHRPIPTPYPPNNLASYIAPNEAPAGHYTYSLATPILSPGQTGSSSQVGFGAVKIEGGEEPLPFRGEDNVDPNNNRSDRDDMDTGGDSYMDVSTEYQATSSGKNMYSVHVNKKPHLTRKDEYTFKDSRGKTRTTERSDWTKTKLDGQTVWRYHHYYTHHLPP